MPADIISLKNAIKSAFDVAMTASQDPEADPETIRDEYADSMAIAIDAYAKTLTLTIAPGLIQVEGSAVAQSNTTPLVIPDALS